MTFEELLAQAIALLQRRGHVTYRALKRQFDLDEDSLEDLKAELIQGQRLAVDEEGVVLVWTGVTDVSPTTIPRAPQPAPPGPPRATAAVTPPPLDAERRQLTVLFCDLVDSTRLASQLGPEDYREVVRAYQATCAEVIQRFGGHIAQYLGDGLLVYFGYPQAQEDDAQRAVRTGLGILDVLEGLNLQLESAHGVHVAVRVGSHTGPVVVGEMGTARRHEQLALGETPIIAARLQGLAAPDTAVLSAVTYRLVQGYFTWQDLGLHTLRGVGAPVQVYRALAESGAQSRLDAAGTAGLTPLVGREEEMALLWRRWAQTKAGRGQVVLLRGEAGIGKSRLVQVLKEQVAGVPHLRWECRCSPYHQQSALYPMIERWQRVLRWQRDEAPSARLQKLEATLAPYRLADADAVPLVAALLSLPLADHYPPLTLTPQRQRQRTLEVLLAILQAMATQQPVLFIVEDLHWSDPSTLEFLELLLGQGADMRLYAVFTCRPEFHPPWPMAAHLTHLTLSRFAPLHIERLATHVAGGKALPAEVVQRLVTQTDGVPLFVEEMTKVVLELDLLQERGECYALTRALPTLAIPTTLHDTLRARLDRLATAKTVVQLGAVLGRTFSYELLQAVAVLDEGTLQQALTRLVEGELLSQRGLPPHATYLFKHALIQEAAYQSLLKRTCQQHHQRIAQVLEAHFPETAETQPELLAHHYTAAGCREHAVGYWQRAGARALQRSANPEAMQHLTQGLALLATLPETPTRAQQELDLQIALGPALSATKGMAAPEVEQTYARARVLCAHVGETPQLFRTLRGLCRFYQSRGALQTARELAEQLARLAQRGAEPTPRLEAHDALGSTLCFLGDYAAARRHLAQGIALTDPATQQALALRLGEAPGVRCLTYAALTLWCLGYPAQALQRSQEALALAQELTHPHSLAHAQHFAAFLHHRRREAPASLALAEALLTLATEQGFPHYVGFGTCWRGGALAMQGQGEAGLAQMRQGMAAVLTTGQGLARPLCLVLLADAAGHAGQISEGLHVLAEALRALEASGRGDLLAEAYRLQGAFLLRHAVPEAAQAEACFQQALTIARRQQAKSWELRAAMSLARLWQQQSKRADAYELLAPVYGWFTEGFDTADLQEAKALLEVLA